ncbi:MAG TPA: DUF6541 family protein [Gaiellaceae bacterium]|nr:DUF6541 family protein [Gaiellaceae bacterium]
MRARLSPSLPATLVLFAISRALPAYGFGLWLRLLAATLLVLLPGRVVARALGQRGTSATITWSLALVAGALAITFAAGGSIDLALALLLSAGAVALLWRRFAPANGPAEELRLRGPVALAGLALGGAIWFVESAVVGDEPFHLGRVRKLVELHSLSLHAIGEFAHGGLHPGYAFPLWHGWLALVARLADVDPTGVIVHESSILVPAALLVAYELGVAVFRSTALGLAAMLAQAALIALAPGHGGSYALLALPATATRQLVVPAAIAFFFAFLRAPTPPLALTLAAASLDLAFVHPTYALFLAILLAAFVVARALLARGADLVRGVVALVAYGIPMALVFLWLRPIVRQTIAVSPGPKALAKSLDHYRGDLVVDSLHSYHLAPEVIARSGSIAVAALVLVPLAVLARQRRWSALVLGGAVAVLGLELWALAFPHFSDAVSLSQSRRLAGFVPSAIAFAGGAAVLARRLRLFVLPLALAAGIALQLAFPGDYGLRTPHNGPGIAAWIALWGGLAALVLGTALAWTRRSQRTGDERGAWTALAAAALFVLPVAVHGFSEWTPRTPHDAYALTPGLVHFLQHDVPARSIVFGDLETSYRATAFAPVYVVAEPPAHVANTHPNRVRLRRSAVLRFFANPDGLAIPRRWGAGWLVLRRREKVGRVEATGLRPVYADDRFVVFRLPPAHH